MITGIAIENFKGIGERVELELRPLTLLFGPNSAGKSTVLHALHYAREIFERHNLDADQTISGGKYIDLGGFEQFVHRNRDSAPRDTQVRIRVDLSIAKSDYPEDESDYRWIGELLEMRLESLIFLPDYEPVKASVEVTVGWSLLEGCPYVANLTFILQGETFAEIEASPNLREVFLKLNISHPSLLREEEWNSELQSFADSHDSAGPTLLATVLGHCGDLISPGDGERIDLSGSGDALPSLDERFRFISEQVEIAPLPKNATEQQSKDRQLELEELGRRKMIVWEMMKGLSTLILGPCRIVRDELTKLRYLGPLRETPPRNYSPPRYANPERWASGLGAWDSLHTGPDSLVEAVGEWLGNEDKLHSGYHLERRKYKEVDLADPLVVQLLTGRAFDEAGENDRIELENKPTLTRLVIVSNDPEMALQPHDVGIGISQVVPVVVTALDGQLNLLAIEQPELHLHPRLQAELADLFIEAALGERRHLIILETHSELIPLRLMRRIRERVESKGPSERPPITARDVAIYYVATHKSSTVVTRLELSERGKLLDPWPEGFFEEGFHERFTD